MKSSIQTTFAALFAALCLAAFPAQAAFFGVGPTANFTVATDNGVVYIYSSSIVSPCANGRAEIRDTLPYSSTYATRLYGELMTARVLGATITFVYDTSTAPACLLNGINY